MNVVPLRLSVVCPDEELVFPMDVALSDLLLYLMEINIILGKSVIPCHRQVLSLRADVWWQCYTVVDVGAEGMGWEGVEEVLDTAKEDKVGSKELFCS